ncbi:MAG TPA: hypothetical protein VLA77_03665 [Candidatus Saccharimonadales bacterium]|nr:hypothetical protein [Candidatus Saccharimonadales bacterium]
MEFFRSDRLKQVRDSIVETTAIRREQFREVNYFRDSPTEIRLRFIAADPQYYSRPSMDDVENLAAFENHLAARELIDELDAKRAAAIAKLPSIEKGASVAERFISFFEERDFKTLDLDRTNHPGGNWDAADSMQTELEQLLAVLDLHMSSDEEFQFNVDTYDLAPENCTMYFHAISPEALEAGLICMTRNTLKAEIYDNLTKDTIFIKKRSEYIYDLNKLNPLVSELIKRKIKGHISRNSYMVEEGYFKFVNDTVEERPEAIELIHSNLFVYREKWHDEPSEPQMPEALKRTRTSSYYDEVQTLEYPELVQAWLEARESERKESLVS